MRAVRLPARAMAGWKELKTTSSFTPFQASMSAYMCHSSQLWPWPWSAWDERIYASARPTTSVTHCCCCCCCCCTLPCRPLARCLFNSLARRFRKLPSVLLTPRAAPPWTLRVVRTLMYAPSACESHSSHPISPIL